MQSLDSFWCFKLGSLSRKIARIYNHRLAELGITLGQSLVLYCLREEDGKQIKDIAAAVQLDSPSVTGLVDRLIKEELVTRKEDPHNRRNVNVFLTPKGQELALTVASIISDFNEYLRQSLLHCAPVFEASITALDSSVDGFVIPVK